MLSDRRQRVLAALIEEYVERALPVGSRTLTEHYDLGVSPATVRNELSVLEDEGYISQPHTSAGRVPTDHGYRAFVDRLIESGVTDQVSPQGRDAVEKLRASATELDDLMEQTSQALSRLTDCLSIVIGPTTASKTIKQITLISLDERRAVLVVVTKDGTVMNRQIEFDRPVDPSTLADVQKTLNRVLSGHAAIDAFSIESATELGQDTVMRKVIDELTDCLKGNDRTSMHRLGMGTLMRKPEFKHSTSLIPIMQVLDDHTLLLHMLETDASGGTPTVRIGAENSSEQLSGVSVVASRYGSGDSAGVVAVIGPTRMDYSRALKAVRIASEALGED